MILPYCRQCESVFTFHICTVLILSTIYMSILGGNNLQTTGVIIRDNMVELIKPPINTSASGETRGLEFKAMGSIPQMAVIDVSITGRNLISPAFSIASTRGIPRWRS